MDRQNTAELLQDTQREPLKHLAPEAARVSMIRRALAVFVMVLGFGGLLSAVPTSEASAAGAGYATVCFTQRGGGAFTGQVAAEYWVNNSWARVTYLTLPTGGCQTVGLVPGYYVRFAVTHRGFYGATGWQYINNGYTYRFTGVASW